jgi:hypothetical protein
MKKVIVSSLLILVLAVLSITTALAYSSSFSFEIISNVQGSYRHQLDAKKTTIKATAKTYAGENISTGVQSYKVSLNRSGSWGWLSTPSFKADGTQKSSSFAQDKMVLGTYCVAVAVSSDNIGALTIKGKGTVNQ